jgi:putative ABC transport system permease protein
MFWNNLKIALRNLRKNKLYAVINIAGLALGLAIYVFGGLLVEYERSHDLFFANAERTYTIGSYAAEDLDVGVDNMASTFSTVGPIIAAELSDVEHVARTISREMLVTMGADSFYQHMRFADSELLQIFDFDYLHGDARALNDPSGILITESSAIKYFGNTNVLGEVVTLDNEYEFYVSAVIRDVPLNSHFNSMVIMDSDLEVVAPLAALGRIRDWDLAGNWDNLSLGNMTYVMLPEHLDQEWLQDQVDGIYERQVPEDPKEVISGLFVKPLAHANLSIWDTIGMPVIAVVQLLSLLVLVVACVNYTQPGSRHAQDHGRRAGSVTDPVPRGKPDHHGNRNGRCDSGAGNRHSIVQQHGRQSHGTRLPADPALAGGHHRGGRPGRGRLPGLADHPCEPHRRTARRGPQREKGVESPRRHDRGTVCDIGFHAVGGHRGVRAE